MATNKKATVLKGAIVGQRTVSFPYNSPIYPGCNNYFVSSPLMRSVSHPPPVRGLYYHLRRTTFFRHALVKISPHAVLFNCKSNGYNNHVATNKKARFHLSIDG